MDQDVSIEEVFFQIIQQLKSTDDIFVKFRTRKSKNLKSSQKS